ncbi:MAG: NupC/NupG family nucleoside CNT transporter [Planctomycetota bacterium]|nr:MAG: NupC/NupG family nucleoside CNT transporter [Planctomycetota bacterium]
MNRFQGLIGIIVLLGIAWLLSNNRRKIRLRIVVWGLSLQFAFAFLILRTGIGERFFTVCNDAVNRLLGFSQTGTDFVLRSFVTDEVESPLINLAFQTLPTVIFFSALLAVLYHLGVMQLIVRGIAWVMQRTMGTSGSETLSVAGNIFVGQTEAPLLVRPFVAGMTKSELLCIMCGGFATIAGGVLAIYVGFLVEDVPEIAGHMMAASVMSAPAAIVAAKILYPETETSQTAGTLEISPERRSRNVLQAVGDGATDGMTLVLNIAAMLIAFVALVALVNALLGWGPTFGVPFTSWQVQVPATSLEQILGFVFRPLAWCMGAPWDEAAPLGRLLGEKIVLTELVAYSHLAEMEVGNQMSQRTYLIASYALCGFANFASIGVQLGGIGAIAPERKADLAELALRAMTGGAIASWLTACVAGLLI